MASREEVKRFIDRVAPIFVEKACGRVKWSLPSVGIAQACCESAYGTSGKMFASNALMGIKVGKSRVHFGTAWNDRAYSTVTKECYDGKTYTNITDMFRAYDCIEDSVEDYYDMLASCTRYAACLNEPDAKRCITAIKNGGYATDPAYIGTIMSIIRVNDLTQYDAAVIGNGMSGNGSEDMAAGQYYPAYKGSLPLAAALDTLGIESSFVFRNKIALANGITGYRGTYDQNIKLLNLLKTGRLRRA